MITVNAVNGGAIQMTINFRIAATNGTDEDASWPQRYEMR